LGPMSSTFRTELQGSVKKQKRALKLCFFFNGGGGCLQKHSWQQWQLSPRDRCGGWRAARERRRARGDPAWLLSDERAHVHVWKARDPRPWRHADPGSDAAQPRVWSPSMAFTSRRRLLAAAAFARAGGPSARKQGPHERNKSLGNVHVFFSSSVWLHGRGVSPTSALPRGNSDTAAARNRGHPYSRQPTSSRLAVLSGAAGCAPAEVSSDCREVSPHALCNRRLPL